MDAAYAALGRTTADYWARRLASFRGRSDIAAADDPLIAWLRPGLHSEDQLLDVGAGTGHYALALAPHVREIVAVEPAEAMRERLTAEATRLRITNLEVLPTRWELTPPLRADIVLCANVLYPLADVVPFVARLDAAATRLCCVYLRELHLDALTNPLWERWHGAPRRLLPTGRDALAVIREMGIAAHAESVEAPIRWSYPDLDAAETDFLEQLILPDEPEVRAALRARLAQWLVERDGRLAVPVESVPSTIIWWSAR
jgi:SAM-dependent methyltransferase